MVGVLVLFALWMVCGNVESNLRAQGRGPKAATKNRVWQSLKQFLDCALLSRFLPARSKSSYLLLDRPQVGHFEYPSHKLSLMRLDGVTALASAGFS